MDLVIRATVVFFFVFLITRVVGRRELSSLEPFDVILLVVLGDLVQQGITQSDQSVTGTLVVISTISLLSVGVGWVSFRSSRARLVAEGEPIVLVQDGEIIERNMRRERLTRADLEEEARKQQVDSLGDIREGLMRLGVRNITRRSAGFPRGVGWDLHARRETLCACLFDADDVAAHRQQRNRDQLEAGQAERDADDRQA